MKLPDITFDVQFDRSGITRQVSLTALIDQVIELLENHGVEPIIDRKTYAVIGTGDGISRLSRLLDTAGFPRDPRGFFGELLKQLQTAGCGRALTVKIGKVVVPYNLLLAVLEVVIPGNKFVTVKTVRQLERLCNISVPAGERPAMQLVLDTYPVRFSLHTLRQMHLSPAVAAQYMPFIDELNHEGLVHTWVGQFHRGVLEQMYRNRVIFILNMWCPVYCRFCFRKHKECRNQRPPTQAAVKEALGYLRQAEHVKEVVLTGGDPFMNSATLRYAIDGLARIPHIRVLRIATRSISYYPDLFYRDDSFWFHYLQQKNYELRYKNKRIEIATHFIHPDEVSVYSLDIINRLTGNGIPVYVQTPFIGGCNDDGDILASLFSRLRAAGAENHYIFMPCSPLQGNRVYGTTIASGFETARRMRAYLSDRAIPKMCTATSIGKIDWNTSGWAVERDEEDPRYLWIRTPYTYEYFASLTTILQLSELVRPNSGGTLDARFMVDVGDDRLLKGREFGRRPVPRVADVLPHIVASERAQRDDLEFLQHFALKDQRVSRSVVGTGSPSISRVHLTRVELDCLAPDHEMGATLKYIKHDRRITDVVLFSRRGIIRNLYRVGRIIQRLNSMRHVQSIRLRSLKFTYQPHEYTPTAVKKIVSFNHLDVTGSKRLEIEARFMHSSEFTGAHQRLVNAFLRRGVTVYNNTPLLAHINDTPGEMNRIAYRCRELGLEFHHCYVAGLPIQIFWGHRHPLDLSRVTRIASFVRKYGSGREIPRYIIRTPLGEVDYDLTSEIVKVDDGGRIMVRLLPYDLEYFRSMDKEFTLPAGGRIDDDGMILVPVDGLRQG